MAGAEEGTDLMRTLESYFIDWEGEAFGYGYGSGEPHIMPALRELFVCIPAEDAEPRNYDFHLMEHALTPTVAWLLLNVLGKRDIIEYGSSPRFGWLTPKGYRLREFILSKTPDELVALACTFDQGQPQCGPFCCNCDPEGHIGDGKPCPNPFYHDKIPEAARAQGQG